MTTKEMTPQEEARERARLLTAWADGERLQRKIQNQWSDYTEVGSPLIQVPEDWCIKKEPQRMWTTPYIHLHTYDQALADEWKLKGWTVTEWMEVLP